MASLIDIGKSGLQSYRQALAVTGQNISNINTEGYKRRVADLEEVTANQGGITSTSAKSGLGVRVADIRRSFDEFLLNKARSATSYAETNEKYVTTLKQLENILLPGDSNLGSMIANFFDGLQEIASSPADLAPRVAALERADAVANSFNQLSYLTGELKKGVEFQIRQDLNDINILNNELFNLNSQLTGSGTQNAQNALLDSRDALIDKLNEFAEITTTLDASGAASLTLGNTGKGPLLLSVTKPTKLGFELVSDKLTFLLEPGSSNTPTSQITNGSLRGLADAYQSIQSVEASIDNLAYIFTRDLNNLHMNGLDLEGNNGEPLFHTVSMETEVNQTNMGNATANIIVSDFRKVENQPATFTYNEEKNIWVGRNEYNEIITQGRGSLSAPGYIINFAGEGREGDQIFIRPAYNAAENIKLAIDRPQEFAAASRQIVSSDDKNVGTGTITAEISSSEIFNDNLSSIDDSFKNGLTANGATQFIRDGSIAIVPSQASNVEFISLMQQSQLSFSLTDDELSSISSITLNINSENMNDDGSITTNNQNYVFSITDASVLETIEEENANLDTENFARLINFGLITAQGEDGNTYSLQDFGGFASGKGNQLTFGLANGEFTDASSIFANSQNLQGTITLQNNDVSSIQIFTREGRHIAGSNLAETQISEIISEENGFFENAVYVGDYLNLSGDTGYLGMNVVSKADIDNPLINVEDTTDYSVISFNIDFLDGVDTTETSFDGKTASASASYYQVNLDDGINPPIERIVYQGQVSGTTEADIAKTMATEIRKKSPISTFTGAINLLNKKLINPPEDFVLPADGETNSFASDKNQYIFSNQNGEISVTGGPEGKLSELSYDGHTNQISFIVSSEPADGDSVIVEFEGQEYTLTKTNNEIEITGGEENRLTAYFNSNLTIDVSEQVSQMALSETIFIRHQGQDYSITKDASGDLSVSGGAENSLSVNIDYSKETGTAEITSEIKQIKIISNDGSLTAARILIPGFDEEASNISGNKEAAIRFGLITDDNSGFGNFAYHDAGNDDTTILENKSELETWTTSGFGEDFFTGLSNSAIGGGILSIDLGELEQTRLAIQSLTVAEISSDNATEIQEVFGFSENELAHYAGSSLTLSDGVNSLDIDFNIINSFENLSQLVSEIQSDANYSTLDFTVTEGTDSLILKYKLAGEHQNASATVTTDLSSFQVLIPSTVISQETLVSFLRNEFSGKLTDASGNYIDLNGTFIIDETQAISKWTNFENIGVQSDETNIILTFDNNTNPAFDDAGISFTVAGDNGVIQSASRTNHVKIVNGFSDYEISQIQQKSLSISNGSSAILVKIDSQIEDINSLIEKIQNDQNFSDLSLDLRAGSDALIFEDKNSNAPLIDFLSVSVIDSYPLNYNIKREGNEIITTSPTGTSADVVVTATSSSVIGERITLSDLPDEELIVVLTGDGTRKISASFDINSGTIPTIEREITVKITSQVDIHEVIIPDVRTLTDEFILGSIIIDASSATNIEELVETIQANDYYAELPYFVNANSNGTGIELYYKMQGKQELINVSSGETVFEISRAAETDETTLVEFIDTETNTSVATRYLDEKGRAHAAGYKIELDGSLALNDQFFISSNANGVGDNRNINLIIARQTSDADGKNTGGFQEIFGTIITGLGAKVQSSEYAAEAASSIKNASLEAEASFSGVNLDTEATNLIELQQAYQASARILSTARELFDTLIQSV